MQRILHLTGLFLLVFASASVLPALFALIVGDRTSTIIFFQCTLVFLFMGGLLVFGITPKSRRMGHIEGCLLLVIIWLVGSVISAFPYLLFLDAIPLTLALFEGVSGFTTTGATIFPRVEVLPEALVLWRSLTGWLGGLFFLIGALLVLGPLRIGGLPWGQKGMLELGGEDVVDRVYLLIETVLPIYITVTVACFISINFLTANVPLFDALCLSLGAISTTGFMPKDADLSFYGSPGLEIILSIFMLYMTTSIFWQRQMIRRPGSSLFSHIETIWLVVGVCFLTLFLTFQIMAGAAGSFGLGIGGALREAFLTVTSLVSTTGYNVRETNFTALGMPLVLTVAIIGGSAYSVSGGLKLYRFAALIIQSGRELQRLLYPHGVRASQIGQVFYDIQIMKAIWSSFAAYLFLITFVAVIASFDVADFEGALLVAVSMVSNIGLLYPGAWGNEATWVPYNEMSAPVLWILMLAMLLGRLEIIAILMLLNLKLWRY